MPELKVIGGGLGQRDQVEELYQRYAAPVRSRCQYLLKDRAEAEDAMHEVFARALQHLGTFRAEASPLTWLMQIATRHCLNLLRSNKALWRQELERMAKLKVADDALPQATEGRELVRAILGEFDQETQAAAIHYYVDEMTLEEVGAAIGRSVPTVRKRLESFAALARDRAARWLGAGKEESHG